MKISATGRIFINFRRDDSAYPAGWLYDRLAARYGNAQVFNHVEANDPGDGHIAAFTEAVGSCEVLLALIGPQWLDLTDPHGKRLLEDPNDYVRLEIEAALEQEVVLIPVLVDGAELPQVEELPHTLAPIARRRALELRSERIKADTNVLFRAVDKIVLARRRRIRRVLIAAGAACAALAAVLVIIFGGDDGGGPDQQATFKCWNGKSTVEGAKCPPLTGLAALKWAYRWDRTKFQEPRCNSLDPTGDGEVEAFQCNWDDLRASNSRVLLERWPTMKVARSYLNDENFGPSEPLQVGDGSGNVDEPGRVWLGRWQEEGAEWAGARFLYNDVPLSLSVFGRAEGADQALKNRDAMLDRIQFRPSDEISKTLQSIADDQP